MDVVERRWDPSPCRRYRYALSRIWDRSLPLLSWGGLNPSRATDPRDLMAAPDPLGERNDDAILHSTADRGVGRVVASWGNVCRHRGRADVVVAKLSDVGVELWCLGINKGGAPEHELYVPYTRTLRRYSAVPPSEVTGRDIRADRAHNERA
jgi:hypothetical protein